MNKYDGFVGLLGVAIGLVGVGYAVGTHTKMAQISDNLDRSIEDLASKTPIDIPDSLIEHAVEKAVAYEVKQAVSKVTDAAIAEVKRDIHKQVSDAVEKEYSNIKTTVLKEITDEAAKIDVNRVRSDVETAAKRIALEKFDDKLDDIVDEFKEKVEGYVEDCKDNLAVVNKVYKTFADAMTPNSSKGTVLHIG